MDTPFGPCHHTHYSGGPPCIHTAYAMGVEDGRHRQIAADLLRDREELAQRITHDEHGCVYVMVSDRPVAVTEEVSHGVMVDRDEDGGIVGVEVLK